MKKKIFKSRKFKKVVAIALTVATTTTLGNGGVYKSVSGVENASKPEQTVVKEKPKVLKELKDERTQNSNTYLMSDGSKKTEIHTDSIRFKDKGNLADFSTKLVKISKDAKDILDEKTDVNGEDYKYINESGNIRQYFPKTLSVDTGVVLNNGKYILNMLPVTEEEYIPQKNESTVTYSTEETNIKYEYISMKNGVKENILLKEKPEKYSFKYKIEGENICLKQRKNDRGILVCDSSTNETIGYISPPNLEDGNGDVDYENVEYKLKKENSETEIEVKLNRQYFDNESLKYPVKVDPTMVWMSDYLATRGVWSVPFMADSMMNYKILNVTNYLKDAYPYNSENRIYLDTTNLLSGKSFVGTKTPLKGKYIESAELIFSESKTPDYYPTGTVQVKRALAKWDKSTITWNSQPKISDDYIAETQCTGEEGNRHTLDITDWVQDIADGKLEDNGLVFTCPEKGMAASIYSPEIQYSSSENGKYGDPLYMAIAVNYREMKSYDETVELNAEYANDENNIQLNITDNNTDDGVTVTGYKIYARKNNASVFSVVGKGTTIDETIKIASDNEDCIDLRACLLYSDGTVRPSNIVSLKKSNEDDDSEITYENVKIDTDGDGLENGYEIWDFKTKWNEKKSDGTYNQDTDGDGFPDGYEVFTLGTDPAVANESGADSDGDGWTDLREYKEGTDPWLKDSDFDEIKDSDDFETTNPRKTDNPQNKGTDRLGACSAEVHKGLYDREYSEYDNGVKTTYLKNIYRNDIKKVTTDYGDENLNKVVKYFYDEKGNNTAVIEENQNDKDHTICITYTYDSDGNVIYICDQKTAYTMEYQDSEMKSLKVGNIELVNNSENIIKSNDEASDIAVGEIINSTENTTTYGNNQKIRTVTTEMKVAENDTTSVARKVEIYYDTNSIPAYTTEYNDAGKIIKFTDNTGKEAVSYNYIYTGDNVKVERNDGFIKTVNTEQNEESGITQKNIEYTYKDILDRNATYKTTQKSDMSDENKVLMTNVFYNNAVLTEESSDNEQTISRKLYSSLNGQGIFNVDEKKNTEQESLYTIIFSGNKKVFSYIYDLAGNITEIKLGDKKIYEYAYDVHGRITKELDYVNKTGCTYGYTSTGNVVAKHIKEINNDGSLTNVRDIKYSYQNGEWADQLTQYDGQKITYDGMGNPIDYIDGKTFKWTRGRQLEQMTLKDGSSVTYKYNQDGLRTYKDTKESITNYQCDDSKLIRETVAYKGDEKKYDIWYFYNNDDEAIGFEYSEVDNSNIVKTPIYFEKNKQGDVIGLLDTKGKELVKYSYDAWGNIVDVSYENETALKLNHITYRGYYKDNESGFYYLQSRYYDSETGRFINADDVKILGIKDTSIYKDNLYCYCNNNVVNCTDPNGKSPIIIYYAYEFIKACVILVGTVIAYCSIKKIMNSFKEYCKLVGNGMSGIAYTVVHGGKRAFSWGKSKIKKAIKAVKAFTEVAKAEAKIRSRVKRTSKTRYWSATLKKGYVDIGRPLSYSQAVKEVSRRHNVFTVTKAEAKAVAKAAGNNKKPTKAEIDKGKNGIIGYYWHYHTYNRNGAHVWYLF